jgi:hypothetical protein
MHVNTSRSRLRWAAAAAALAGAVVLTTGCRQQEVTHYRVPKVQPLATGPVTAVNPTAFQSPPAAGAPAQPAGAPAQPAASGLTWTLPRGWTQEVAGGMRYATLKPPVPGKIDGSVVVLPGPAGGELANVNRWRGQIGLPPIDEAALAAARKPLKTAAGPVSLYEFGGAGATGRMLAALTDVDGSTWFLKLTGDDAAVAAAKPDFLHLVESLRRGANR